MVALHDAKILVSAAAIALLTVVLEIPLVALQLAVLAVLALAPSDKPAPAGTGRGAQIETFVPPGTTATEPAIPTIPAIPAIPTIPEKDLQEFVEARDSDPPELTHFRTTYGRFTLTADQSVSSSHKWTGPSSAHFIGGDISAFVTVDDALPDYEVNLLEFTGTDSEGDTVRLGLSVTGGVAPEVVATLGPDARVAVPVTAHTSVRTFYVKYSKTTLAVGFFDHYVARSQGVADLDHEVRVLNGNEFPITLNKTMVKLRIRSVAIYAGVLGDEDDIAVREALRKMTFLKVDAYKKLHDSYSELKTDLDERRTTAPFAGVEADCGTVDWSRYDPSSATPQCRSAILRSCQADPTQPLCGCWNTESSEYSTLQCMAYRLFYGSEEPLVVKEVEPDADADADADDADADADGTEPASADTADGAASQTSPIRKDRYAPQLTWYSYFTDDLPL